MNDPEEILTPRATLGSKNHNWRICPFILLLLLTTATHAQTFSIDWFRIAGGGGTSTGGVFTVSGTIGQPTASPGTPGLAGGNFTLTDGLWSLFALQTPGAPLLTITLTSTNTALVSWPSLSTGFVLQQNNN